MNINELKIDHPYYCSTVNYYDNQCSGSHITWPEFWEEYEGVNPDYNLLFRWDVEEYEKSPGRYSLTLFYIGQRKGQFWSVHISLITQEDMPAIEKYLKESWSYMNELWAPISGAEPAQGRRKSVLIH